MALGDITFRKTPREECVSVYVCVGECRNMARARLNIHSNGGRLSSLRALTGESRMEETVCFV